jgi:hypothetical protein
MNVFDYVPNGKLNDLDITFPTSSNLETLGPNPLVGMLGEEFEYDEATALKLSNTSKGTLFSCLLKLVRFHPTSTASNLVGRPVFWSNKTSFVVTPDAAATSVFAGISICANAKGNIGFIVVAGEVEALFVDPLTKATPVVNNRANLSIAAGVAALDVLADATAVTWGTLQTNVAIVRAAVTAGAKSRVSLLTESTRIRRRGIH